MSAFLFVKAILQGKPIRAFNNGDMRRDFAYLRNSALYQGLFYATRSGDVGEL
jgi:nucleoside-diphosphate-sugar epimerase